MRTVLIAVLIACVALGAWLLWRAETPAPRAAASEVGDVVTTAVPTPDVSSTAVSRTAISSLPAVDSSSAIPAAAPITKKLEELSATEITPLEVETPPGVLEGIVLVGRTPLAGGGTVYFRSGYYSRLPEQPRQDPALRSAVIDAQGEFRIRDLEAGMYTLALDLGHGAQHETSAEVSASKSGRRIVVVLGTARIHGYIYDEHGVPVAGARVCASGQFARRGSFNTFRTSRASRLDGGYELTELAAGAYWFTVKRAGAWDSNGDTDSMQQVTLTFGEDRVIDFGAPEPAVTWSGKIVTQGGADVRGPGKLHLVNRDGAAYSVVPFSENGTYDAQVRPGTYELALSFDRCQDARRTPLPDLRVEGRTASTELVVSGARISGVVVDAATGAPSAASVAVSVSLNSANGGSPRCSMKLEPDGRFVVDGLRPGTYRASTHPLALTNEYQEVTIAEGELEVPLHLSVRQR